MKSASDAGSRPPDGAIGVDEPFALAEAAADALRTRTGHDQHDVVIVLGSGWADAADQLGVPDAVFPATDLPGFAAPSALGHSAMVRSVQFADLRVLIFLGRVHLYEGLSAHEVVHGIRTAAAAGCSVAILTNGAGYMNQGWHVGQPVLIRDHLNFTGRSPLTGPNPPAPYGSRFCDLTDLYSERLRSLLRRRQPSLPEGVYVGLHGPHFETPAEIRAFHGMGAELVGMSTVLEAIAARHMGMEVLGVSLATNPAAGFSAVPLDADDVIAAGRSAAGALGVLLADALEMMAGPHGPLSSRSGDAARSRLTDAD